MKKIVSLVLALMMVFTLAVTAFASSSTLSTPPANGTITINGLGLTDANVPVADYKIYRILDLYSYDRTGGRYSYTINSEWVGFFTEGTGALDYFAVDSGNYVTWIAATDEDTVVAFSQLALAYAKDHTDTIHPVKTTDSPADYVAGKDPETGTYLKFENLTLGYYLVDSTVGALCGLTTTDPDASIQAKNGIPTLEKHVKEDASGQWGETNSADIGQMVEFLIIIHVQPGAENYVFHDVMGKGITFDKVTKIQHIAPGVTDLHDMEEGVDYVVKTGSGMTHSDCSFEIHFTPSCHEKLNPNDRIYIYYQGMLNREAVIKDANSNNAYLTYGEDGETTHDSTQTHTYQIQIVKTDSSNNLINDAEFKIYTDATGGVEVGVVPLMKEDEITPVKDANGNQIYRRARPDEEAAGKTVPILVNGVATVIGLDNGTYYLEEIRSPEGYNKLTARQRFIVADDNLNAVFNETVYSTGSGVHVVNKTGTMLPETGAMGTTMFIFFGALLVLSTGVLLVTKKRMSMIED